MSPEQVISTLDEISDLLTTSTTAEGDAARRMRAVYLIGRLRGAFEEARRPQSRVSNHPPDMMDAGREQKTYQAILDSGREGVPLRVLSRNLFRSDTKRTLAAVNGLVKQGLVRTAAVRTAGRPKTILIATAADQE